MKIAVCDDQKIIRNQIVELISLYNDEIIIFEYCNGKDLLAEKEQFDLIFLDIEMLGMDGMSVAREIRKRKDLVRIVFLTSHSEYVYDAFEVKAFRFLNKPIEAKSVELCINEVEEELRDSEKIIINQKGNIYSISLDKITYMEAYGDGTYIYDEQGEVYDSTLQLKEWEKKLKEKGFFRIHRSYLISLSYISKIEEGKVSLRNVDDKLLVSRRNMAKFKEEYLLYIKKNARMI